MQQRSSLRIKRVWRKNMRRTDTMRFREEELQEIGNYVRAHLGEWMKETDIREMLEKRDFETREQLVRLDAQLVHQGELLTRSMDLMEKRFEQVDKRFEQVDKRFEQVDKRFEQVDKRFEQVDKRFEEMLHYMDKRFEQVDKRFESVEKRLISLETSIRRFVYSSFSFTAAAAGVIIAVVKLA
jgi:predicted  nucleic acid-binding Zn-ribbon protein